jgi:hypothetical protein
MGRLLIKEMYPYPKKRQGKKENFKQILILKTRNNCKIQNCKSNESS